VRILSADSIMRSLDEIDGAMRQVESIKKNLHNQVLFSVSIIGTLFLVAIALTLALLGVEGILFSLFAPFWLLLFYSRRLCRLNSLSLMLRSLKEGRRLVVKDPEMIYKILDKIIPRRKKPLFKLWPKYESPISCKIIVFTWLLGNSKDTPFFDNPLLQN